MTPKTTIARALAVHAQACFEAGTEFHVGGLVFPGTEAVIDSLIDTPFYQSARALTPLVAKAGHDMEADLLFADHSKLPIELVARENGLVMRFRQPAILS